jgi:hypothetical protein
MRDAFQRYFKLLTNNQNNFSKEKSIFEYFLELVVSQIKFISNVLVKNCIKDRTKLLNATKSSKKYITS